MKSPPPLVPPERSILAARSSRAIASRVAIANGASLRPPVMPSSFLSWTEDLVLKSFVAARCARRQLEIERGEASRVAEMEECIALLEREKANLEFSLSFIRTRAESSLK